MSRYSITLLKAGSETSLLKTETTERFKLESSKQYLSSWYAECRLPVSVHANATRKQIADDDIDDLLLRFNCSSDGIIIITNEQVLTMN